MKKFSFSMRLKLCDLGNVYIVAHYYHYYLNKKYKVQSSPGNVNKIFKLKFIAELLYWTSLDTEVYLIQVDKNITIN